jgi:hypothetical protein
MPSGRSNLENLARAKQLNAEPPDELEIANLASRAETFLRDARNAGNSVEGRFTLAYNAAHALALAALRSAGYRPSSAGHRRIVFQVLEFTADAPKALSLALAQYHDRRNRIEYEGASVSAMEMTDLVKLAAELQSLLLKRLKK